MDRPLDLPRCGLPACSARALKRPRGLARAEQKQEAQTEAMANMTEYHLHWASTWNPFEDGVKRG